MGLIAMKKLQKAALMAACLITSVSRMNAQTTASSAMQATGHAPSVPFNIGSDGVLQPVRWGIDTAWLWDWWPLRATNHMRECVSIGRVTIDPRVMGTHTALSSEQTERLDLQLSWLKKSGVKDLYLLCGNASGQYWQTSFRNPFVADIVLGVEYLHAKGYNVIAIAPFNEPDFGSNNAPGPEEMAVVSRMVRAHDTTKNIDVCGPNTLNADYAYAWWETMKNDVQVGNTHQLAGTFDSFAGFYEMVAQSGKKSVGDEMHNINDALIGMNYGMNAGIWWSDYGGYTRAELGCASNDGARIGYKENRSLWTSAAVFKRHSEELVEAFLGTSERQAGESAFTFVSQDRLAYYDGYGPYYDYTKGTPGGTGYQSGQTNAEYVIEITHGEDVPVGPINGKFKIVNKASGRVLSPVGGSLSGGTGISLNTDGATHNQVWMVEPVDYRCGGDFSYAYIYNASNLTNRFYLDGQKYDAANGAKVMLYPGGGNECERWHLRYKGNGYYVLTNHDSGLSLEGSTANSDATSTGVVQWERTGTDRQLWRFIPADAEVEFVAPAVPSGLQAKSLSGSVCLTWAPNTEADLLGYMVYRYNEQAGIWETIGRRVVGTEFIDNICAKGKNYRYRLRAVDKAWNVSEASEEISCATSTEPALLAHWDLYTSLDDRSENLFHGTAQDVTFSADDIRSGVTFDGASDYISMPYHLADMQEMTFSVWVKAATVKAWQRVFDFGRNTENYLFLTPSNGTCARFEICKDGVKQGLNATKRLSADTWTHIALTMGKDSTMLYIDGQLSAATADITFRPSDVAPSLAYIGRSMFDSDPLFHGMMSDIRFYNYSLTAAAVSEQFYGDMLGLARSLVTMPMYASAHTALAEAIETTETAIGVADASSITSALRSLRNAMSRAKTSIDAYAPLGEMLEWSQLMAQEYPQEDIQAQAAYDSAYVAMEADYLGGVLSNGKISAALTTVKSFTNTYLMADFVLTATASRPKNITHLIWNPAFEGNSTNSWTVTTSNPVYKGTVNYDCVEFKTQTFNISQVLYGMPNGQYRLRTQAFYRNGAKENSANKEVYAKLYLNDSTITIAPISRGANSTSAAGEWYAYATSKRVPNDQQAASEAFNTLKRYTPSSSSNTLIADYDNTQSLKLTVGIKKTKAITDDWTVINSFTLHYLGVPEETAIESPIPDAEAYPVAIYTLSGNRLNEVMQGINLIRMSDGTVRKVIVK